MPETNFNVHARMAVLLFFDFVGFAVSALAGQPRQNHSYKFDLVPITIEVLHRLYPCRVVSAWIFSAGLALVAARAVFAC